MKTLGCSTLTQLDTERCGCGSVAPWSLSYSVPNPTVTNCSVVQIPFLSKYIIPAKRPKVSSSYTSTRNWNMHRLFLIVEAWTFSSAVARACCRSWKDNLEVLKMPLAFCGLLMLGQTDWACWRLFQMSFTCTLFIRQWKYHLILNHFEVFLNPWYGL